MRTFTICVICAVVSLLIISCATPEERAHKLYEQGKYQEVVDQFGDASKFKNPIPSADSARTKLGKIVGPKAIANTTPATTSEAQIELLTATIFSGFIARHGDSESKLDGYLARSRELATRIHQGK